MTVSLLLTMLLQSFTDHGLCTIAAGKNSVTIVIVNVSPITVTLLLPYV